MENYDKASEYMDVAANSSGTAVKKYEAYLDSIAAKSEAFKASFQELSSTIIDSDLIKGTFDAGTGILGFLNAVIKTMGTVPTAAGVGGIVSFFKSLGEPKMTGFYCAYSLLEDAA